MGIARLQFLVACMLWVMCWSGQRANGQSIGTLHIIVSNSKVAGIACRNCLLNL